MSFNEKGLGQLPSPVKVFIISYEVLIVAGLLVSFWVVLLSPILRGGDTTNTIKSLEEAGLTDEVNQAKAAQFYAQLKLAHVHHLGHIFMVFSVAGIYAFTRQKNNVKTQVIVWATISTLMHTLAFLINSRILLIFFGSAYGILLTYMLVIIFIDCFKPFHQ